MNLDAAKQMMESFGRAFVFEKYREPLRQYFMRAGFNGTPYGGFGIGFLITLAITYVTFLGFLPLLGEMNAIARGLAALIYWIIVPLALVGFIMLVVLFVLNLRIYARVREMEANLDEYLALVVTNLKSGMNFEQSLWSAARPEFGILSDEITLVSKKVLTGGDTASALHEFTLRYDSPTLTRSFGLITSELQSGGKVVHVIERIVSSLKRTRELKDEMSANVLNFIIFIAVIVCVLTPVLFALANTLLGVMINFASLLSGSLGGSSASIGGGAGFGEKLGNLAATGDQVSSNFRNFSYAAIGIIAFSASLIISIIEKGDIRGGIKYVPLFTIVSMVIFGVVSTILVNAFSGLV
jgi:hypothetical protein